MKTIYGIVSGYYSDYLVHFLFSERESAEKWIAIHNESYEIEEFTLDPDGPIETVKSGYPVWHVRFYANGKTHTWTEDRENIGVYPLYAKNGKWISTGIVVRAKNSETATKVANERWMQMKAEGTAPGQEP